MKLYLVRHGEAHPSSVDPHQGLTEQGRLMVEKVAGHLKTLNVIPVNVWHSEKLRAKQTAEILCDILRPRGDFLENTGLSPNGNIEDAKILLDEETEDLMWVSHLPFVGDFVSYVTKSPLDTPAASFGLATVVCLSTSDHETWKQEWVVSSESVNI